jgi:hypothetical protein
MLESSHSCIDLSIKKKIKLKSPVKSYMEGVASICQSVT